MKICLLLLASALAGCAARDTGGSDPRRESTLDAQLAGLKSQIASRQAYNEKLAATITAKEQQLQAMLASDRSSGPTAQEFELRTAIHAQLAGIDRDARSWKDTIAAHQAVLEKVGDDPRRGQLLAEIERLSAQQTEVTRQRARLTAMNDQLRP